VEKKFNSPTYILVAHDLVLTTYIVHNLNSEIVQHIENRGTKTINGIDKDAYKLQDNFSVLHSLKIIDDVLILRLQEEFSFNECDQTIIQKILSHLAS